MSYLNFKQATINEYALSLKRRYSRAKPYQHIVLNNAFNEKILEKLLEEIPDLFSIKNSNKVDNPYEKKSATLRGGYKYGENGRKFFNYLNSSEFIDFLQVVTSINEPLIGDPHLIGGGLHQTRKGGLLKIHADFCRHPETNLDRRINVLIYLNKEWDLDYGGALELWDKNMKFCVKKVYPVFNRMIIFNTTDYTFHGLPNPLNCPDNIIRKSIAMYYYSNGRPAYELRPENFNQSTLFKNRPGEIIFNQIKSNNKLKELITDLIPPLFIKMYKKLLVKK